MSRNPFADWKLGDVARRNSTVTCGAVLKHTGVATPIPSGSTFRDSMPHTPVAPVKANRFAKFKRREKGERNKLEAAYELHLGALERAGEIEGFMFEGIKLKLADNTHYIPDFIVYAKDGVVELHDTKGTTTKKRASGSVKAPWIEEDARIKLKIVAERFPFRTFAVFKTKDGWQKQQF